MGKNKYDFIAEFLEQRKFTPSQKEKILKLVTQELKSESDRDQELIKRIGDIEKKLDNIIADTIDQEDNKASQNLLKKVNSLPKNYINPSNLSSFLYNYNQNSILKYTCHEIDDESIIQDINNRCRTEEYTFTLHQKLIAEEYKEFEKKYQISRSIRALIQVYLNGRSNSGNDTLWSSEDVELNWNSPELIEWSRNNPGIVPNPGENLVNKTHNNGFEFKKAFTSGLTGKRIRNFSELVIHFKYLFHIRADNPLKALIERKNETEQWGNKIDFEIDDEEFWTNLELFTDIDKLLQAYKAIVCMILDVSTKTSDKRPKVRLAFKQINSGIIFTIHHINSCYRKSIQNTIDRPGDEYTRLIDNQINGLCDLYLTANFGHNNYAEINLWDGKARKYKELSSFNGVEHKLIFKK